MQVQSLVADRQSEHERVDTFAMFAVVFRFTVFALLDRTTLPDDCPIYGTRGLAGVVLLEEAPIGPRKRALAEGISEEAIKKGAKSNRRCH